eukprot:13688-Heterococcus_DN1.PRE.4
MYFVVLALINLVQQNGSTAATFEQQTHANIRGDTSLSHDRPAEAQAVASASSFYSRAHIAHVHFRSVHCGCVRLQARGQRLMALSWEPPLINDTH